MNIKCKTPILNKMVEYNSDKLDSTLHALADSTRRDILNRLAGEEKTISELAEPYNISLAAVSKHIKVLEKAKLIVKEKEGRSIRCRMNYEPLISVVQLIEKYRSFWESRLDEMENFINDMSDSSGG